MSDSARYLSNVAEAPGRPRLPQTDGAIAAAVVDSLIHEGIEGTSVEGVAKRSGVGRPTIYRRYANKYDMIEACIAELFDSVTPDAPASEDSKADLQSHLRHTVGMLTESQIGPLFRAVLSDVPRHPRIAALVNRLGQKRRRRFVKLLEIALNAGAIQIDQDPDTFADALLGAIYFRFLMGRPLSNAYALTMFEALIRD